MSTVIAENFLTPNGTGVVPVGTVIMYYGANAPTGYLECDGQSTSGYDDLLALIGSNVPDLRGEFVRGWDNGRGVDTGRALGSTQDDEFKEHQHTIDTYLLLDGANLVNQEKVIADDDRSNSVISKTTNYEGGTETRPRNISLMYCIKY
ncbi:tail collar fiber protein [Synechococcus phage S-CAM7]|uniref:Putative tail fiber protein n=1 Tax=Synechococcus phage S-CAM7 TaxID=1883368 RepID=A0A1D8KTZ6_9CAUD|nr:tail collar fiber protein [Synechococcus phage S-CAM7]AOV62131.1 putative tail fiber protein [Synechococcus phage S-CAM7]